MSIKAHLKNDVFKDRCPACNSDRVFDIWLTSRIPGNKMILWCGSCGFGWQHPLPSCSDIRFYYHRFPTYNIHGGNEKELGFKRRIQRLAELIPQRGRLLDIGAGLGVFLKLAIQNGWQATGIEPQPSAAVYCQKHLGIKPYVGFIEDVQLRPQSFDVVTIWDVWEHVHAPLAFIDRCIELLAPNGILALSIPNASGYPARLFKGNWRYVMFTHLSYFTLPYVNRVMSERNMLFQWADHTVKAQSLLQGFAALLSKNLDTEKIIRCGRKNRLKDDGSQIKPRDSISKKKANPKTMPKTLSWIRQLVLKGNLCPLPITRGDMMDLYFRRSPD
jgi:2-polyprenyl-3-methyl-5-hydroxy-6-metoxy-1,4-benzoquinol methylase